MKHLKHFADLQQYGINLLTGEACAYSLRYLCDVNEDGKRLLESFFGSTISILPKTNWNSTVNGKDAIGSIMLTRGVLKDLLLFCLFHIDKFPYVIEIRDDVGEGILGITEEEWIENEKSYVLYGNRRINWAYHRSDTVSGDRNVHQMSGRVS